MTPKIEVKKEYYDNGMLKSERYYKDGKLDGSCRFYTETGKLWATEDYKDGKRWGMIIECL